MFLTFKMFVIYLIILSKFVHITSIDGETTLSLQDEAKKELSPIKDSLKKIVDSTNIYEKLELKGEVQGKIEKIIERAIKADKLLKNIGGLEKEKKEADKYRLLLGITFRIDRLESMLAPELNFKGKSRANRWMSIFKKQTEAVLYLRKKLNEAGMNKMSFIDAIERLCDERNNMAGHARIPLPKNVDDETVKEALDIMKIIHDKYTVEAVKIIISPIDGVDFNTISTTTGATDEAQGAIDEAQGAIDEAQGAIDEAAKETNADTINSWPRRNGIAANATSGTAT